MVEFFQLLVAAENLLFLTSLLVFFSLLTLQLLGFAGDVLVGEIGGVDPGIDNLLSDGTQFPIVTLFMLFFGSFGILGILSNVLLVEYFELETIARVVISIVLSGGVSLVFARRTARTVGSWLPTVETHGIDGTNLNGCYAKVISETMTVEGTGRISVTDRKAGNYTLRGKLLEGYEAVANGEVVVVVKHDQNSDICFCVPASAWSLPQD